jgi:cell division protein YceG involved in septum cleavage
MLLILAAASAGAAHGQDADVALVTLLSGDVTYVSRAGPPGAVKPYMKLREGDRINVAAGARVRIAYFEGSRQELWSGPAAFKAGKAAAESTSGKAAVITNLPAGVAQHMTRIPELVMSAKLGGIKVRGMAQREQEAGADRQSTLAQARSAYATMQREMPADDIAPELYLYAALYEFHLYDQMKPVVAEMLRKQPDNQDAKALDNWLAARLSR